MSKRERDTADNQVNFHHRHSVSDWQRKFVTPAFNPSELSLAEVNPGDKVPLFFLSIPPIANYETNVVPVDMFPYLRAYINRTNIQNEYIVQTAGVSAPIKCPPGVEPRQVRMNKEDPPITMATWRLFPNSDAFVVVAAWNSSDGKNSSMPATIIIVKCAHFFKLPVEGDALAP